MKIAAATINRQCMVDFSGERAYFWYVQLSDLKTQFLVRLHFVWIDSIIAMETEKTSGAVF